MKVSKKQYKFLQANDKRRFVYLFGGAGSGKSWAIAQYLIVEKMYRQPRVGILALRWTRPSVRTSCLKLVKYWLDQMGLPYAENKTDTLITAPNGSYIKFDSVDDVEKKKSIEGINYIWIEEATELTERDIMQLNLRCRAANPFGINQLYFSFNPIDPIGNAWLKKFCDNAETNLDAEGNPDSAVMCVTYGDNPFLSQGERNQIEALANQDREYDLIYRQGQWATPTHIIYTNWDIVDSFPDYCENIGYGLDFGFVNPTALVKVGVKDSIDIYIQEVIYESNLTNTELINRLKTEGLLYETIIADCAEPDRIQEIAQAGFECIPCIKGAGSVTYGIDCCKRKRLHIVKGSDNILTEIRGYKHKLNRQGEVTEEPLEYRDHGMDAMRYYLSALDGMMDEAELIEVGQMV